MDSEIKKLGIAVVYLVSERNGILLDLHLKQIEKNTEVPYTIYGSANRLLPQFRSRLENDPHVRICECETFDVSSWNTQEDVFYKAKHEHAYYLEKLIRMAVDDGVSHVAILHVDSFPIEKGWAKKLAAKLTQECVLTGIVRDRQSDYKPLTAGMLYHREFYLKYNPRLLLTREEMAAPAYQKYRAEICHERDSGSGYGFKLYSEGLTFYPLCRSDKVNTHPFFGGVYDDILFHVGAVAMKDASGRLGYIGERTVNPLHRVMNLLEKAVRRTVGHNFYANVIGRIPLRLRRPDQYKANMKWELERELFFKDPEAHLKRLRSL